MKRGFDPVKTAKKAERERVLINAKRYDKLSEADRQLIDALVAIDREDARQEKKKIDVTERRAFYLADRAQELEKARPNAEYIILHAELMGQKGSGFERS